jgi:sugar phosphate isomerase/epimerase
VTEFEAPAATERLSDHLHDRRSSLGPHDLVLAAGTLSRTGNISMATAVAAAQAGGFAGVSLWATAYMAALAAGSSPASLRGLLSDAAVVVDHVEAVIGWVGPDDPGGPYAEEASPSQVFDAAVALGASQVSALLFGHQAAGEDDASEVFARIAAQANDHGLRVALEFAEDSVIRDVNAAIRVTSVAPNGGVLVDTWHAHYGVTTLADLTHVPGERVLVVQVNDGPSQRPVEYGWATRWHRLMPGDGGADPAAAVAALRAAGCRAPLTAEVFNDELVTALGPLPFAIRVGEAMASMERGR